MREGPVHSNLEERAERIVLRIWETVVRENKVGNGSADQYEKFHTLVKEVAEELERIEKEEGKNSGQQQDGEQAHLPGSTWEQQEPGVDY